MADQLGTRNVGLTVARARWRRTDGSGAPPSRVQLFSRGPLVELLIATHISRYLEFKALDHTFLRIGNAWERVPSSKEDVFQSRLIGVVEKRMLMKFLTFCLSYQTQPAEYEGTVAGRSQEHPWEGPKQHRND